MNSVSRSSKGSNFGFLKFYDVAKVAKRNAVYDVYEFSLSEGLD